MMRNHEFARFVIVGVLATALQYLILIGLVRVAHMDAVLASSLGFALSACLNYWLNRRYTFRSGTPHSQALPRFMLVASSGLLINATAMWLVSAHVHYLLAQAVASACTLAWNYFLNRIWTFATPLRRGKKEKSEGPTACT